MQDQFEESSTTVFPVHMFKVSREWIDILFTEIKKNVMTKAISHQCSNEFLALLNEMSLSITNDAKVNVCFGATSPLNASNLSTVASPEPSSESVPEAPKEETPPA
ncbi:hypothetical protein K1X76_03125 [bacterium]|nr:hypothetical protein [bacterium]